MKTFIALAVVFAVVSGRGEQYRAQFQYAPVEAPAAPAKVCVDTYETVEVEECKDYNDKVCTVTYKENCVDVGDRNCRAIVTSREERKCFNVTELLCGLKETVSYKVVDAVFTVQKCYKATERVCDTVYDSVVKARDDFQCITLSNPVCQDEEEVLNEETCRTTHTFKCPDAYKAGYGEPCQVSQESNCYDTPRTFRMSKCQLKDDRVCQKLTEQLPYPAEKQVCHDEYKKVCELHPHKQPKQVKQYDYTLDCRSVARTVCDTADVKKLVPSCVPATTKQCSLTPVKNCEDVPKQHCRLVTKKVPSQKCEYE